MPIKNYGFIAPQEIKPEEWRFGGGNISGPVLQEDCNWSAFLPKVELQATDYETSGCTVYGSLNQIEILHKRLYGEEINKAERFNYIQSGCTIQGNDPQRTYESLRGDGVIDEFFLPRPSTYEEYNSPHPMYPNLIKEGQEWKRHFEYKHDWLFVPSDNLTAEQKRKRIQTGLKYCPIGVSVTAWVEENGIYVDGGMPNTHWTILYGDSDKGYLCFDTYDQTLKVVSHDHNLQFAKTIFLKKREVPLEEVNWLVDLWRRFLSFLRFFKI